MTRIDDAPRDGSTRTSRWAAAAALLTTLTLAGCSAMGLRLQSPIAVLREEQRMGPGKMTAAEIQSEIMSFTDTFSAAVSEALNNVAARARADFPDGVQDASGFGADQAARVRRTALYSKLALVGASLSIAASPNPTVGLADMITMVTLERMVLESPRSVDLFGEEQAAALAEVFRRQERRVWEIADRAMSEAQREELRTLIIEWRQAHPNSTYVANIRLEDFAAVRQETLLSQPSSGGSLLSLLALDPLAGLDPAQRDLQKSRMLGERIFFYGSRLPQLLKWHAETLYQGLFQTPEFGQMLAALGTASATAPGILSVIEELPRDVAAEREATMTQLFDGLGREREATMTQLFDGLAREREATLAEVFQGLTTQRQELLRDLEARLAGMDATFVELRETLAAADKMSTSMTSTLTAAHALADRVMSPPGVAAPTMDEAHGLLDYCAAVTQTASATEQLTTLVREIDELLSAGPRDGEESRILEVSAELQSASRGLIDLTSWRLLLLVIVAPFTTALAAWLYRRATARTAGGPS